MKTLAPATARLPAARVPVPVPPHRGVAQTRFVTPITRSGTNDAGARAQSTRRVTESDRIVRHRSAAGPRPRVVEGEAVVIRVVPLLHAVAGSAVVVVAAVVVVGTGRARRLQTRSR